MVDIQQLIVNSGNGYVLGRGKMYATPFTNADAMTLEKGVPSEFFGNIPTLGLTINSTNYDHYDSTGGIREKDASVPLQTDRSCAFTVEKMSANNFSKWMLGSSSINTQAAVTGFTETIDSAYLDRTYHVGVTNDNPVGVSLLDQFALFLGKDVTGTKLTPSVDYIFDAKNGTFKILATAPNIKGDGSEQLFVQTNLLASKRIITASGNQPFRGRVDYIADSGYGENINITMPNVTIRPNGELSLIGDTFMGIPLTMDINKLGDMPALLIEGQAVELNG